MTCNYVTLRGDELTPEVCGHSCQGDYCIQHQRMMDPVDQLDRDLLKMIREIRESKSQSQRGTNL